jgi:hypothetical protein
LLPPGHKAGSPAMTYYQTRWMKDFLYGQLQDKKQKVGKRLISMMCFTEGKFFPLLYGRRDREMGFRLKAKRGREKKLIIN